MGTPTKSTMQVLPISVIRRDGNTQCRVRMCQDAIQRYVDAIERGEALPRVASFFDGESYWLADGFHRVESFIKAGKSHIEADVFSGAKRDAFRYAASANSKHGVPRTREDLADTIRRLLLDPEWLTWADTRLAQIVKCDHKTVTAHRERLEATKEILRCDPLIGVDGRPVHRRERLKKSGEIPQTLPVSEPLGDTNSTAEQGRSSPEDELVRPDHELAGPVREDVGPPEVPGDAWEPPVKTQCPSPVQPQANGSVIEDAAATDDNLPDDPVIDAAPFVESVPQDTGSDLWMERAKALKLLEQLRTSLTRMGGLSGQAGLLRELQPRIDEVYERAREITSSSGAKAPDQDDLGIPVQEHAREAFDAVPVFRRVLLLLKDARSELTPLANMEGGKYLEKSGKWLDNHQRWSLAHLDNAISTINRAMPAVADCPYAHNPKEPHARNCAICHGLGWLPSPKSWVAPRGLEEAMLQHYGLAQVPNLARTKGERPAPCHPAGLIQQARAEARSAVGQAILRITDFAKLLNQPQIYNNRFRSRFDSILGDLNTIIQGEPEVPAAEG